MTKAEQICRVAGIVLTRREVYACAFLEARGQSIYSHFTRDNCEQKAGDLWTRELDGIRASLFTARVPSRWLLP